MSQVVMLGQLAGALIAILTLGGILVKWGIVKPIKAYIDTMTYQIQPHANGGRSLPDLVNSVDDLKYLLSSHIKDHDTPK
jgi:hypothetical protein